MRTSSSTLDETDIAPQTRCQLLGQRIPVQFPGKVDEAEAPERLALSVPERSGVGTRVSCTESVSGSRPTARLGQLPLLKPVRRPAYDCGIRRPCPSAGWCDRIRGVPSVRDSTKQGAATFSDRLRSARLRPGEAP